MSYDLFHTPALAEVALHFTMPPVLTVEEELDSPRGHSVLRSDDVNKPSSTCSLFGKDILACRAKGEGRGG